MIHIWPPWKLSNFQAPHPHCPSASEILPPPRPWTSNFKRIPHLPPFHMITNQLKENIIQGWLLYVIRSFLQVGFHFHCQLINHVWVSFDFLSLSWSHYLLFRGFIYLCEQLSKNNTKCLLFIIIHIFNTHFATTCLFA